jgi:hypothetical protein
MTDNTQDKKILFVVSTIQHYRNYLKSGALDEIKNRLIILADPGLSKVDFGISNDRVFYYSYPGRLAKWHRHVFNINRWRNRWRSTSIAAYLSKLEPSRLRIYKFLSLPVISTIAKFILLELARDKKMAGIIQLIKPSLMLIPSSLYDAGAFELIRICKQNNTPSFVLVDNWDNLSSKTIFTFKPDYIGVWSQQCLEHAVNVTDMAKAKVYILGTPRFIDYFKPGSKNQSSPYPFKYILFAGSSLEYNEIGALKKIDDIVEKNNLNIKIVFRPAQTQRLRNCPDVFFEYNYKHIILDIPARAYYKREPIDGFSPAYVPDLSYYPKLLANMEFMICPLSTMIIEASIFEKKVFALAYDDGVSPYGLKHHFDKYIHFKDIDRLDNVRMVYKLEDMEKIFLPGDTLKQNKEPIGIDYFISRKAAANYPSNLKKIIDDVIISWRYE